MHIQNVYVALTVCASTIVLLQTSIKIFVRLPVLEKSLCFNIQIKIKTNSNTKTTRCNHNALERLLVHQPSKRELSGRLLGNSY